MTTSCWFLVFIRVCWLPLVLVAAKEQQGYGCTAERCGNLTISSSLWLSDLETGRPCGPRDFEVACSNNTPVLRSSQSTTFAIMNISYEERSLHVVDLHKEEDFNCHFPRWNTSGELGLLFKVSPTNMNLIFYNCTKTATHLQRVLVEMSCGNGSNAFVHAGVPYDPTRVYGGYALEGCDTIIMPVLGSLSEANASEYKKLISDGFLLT
ncbi:uncharacterized protein LOC119266831 [Triticum dicoccoides]|uniref:uncharacterized protein LOC119266831 n=1 Tax=Triticum dicoccoides TaxID=85692 RepID=UPI00188E5CC3|nr:uncharacterized protein LOC119266831 [Triticum dicoccoides]XP_044338486.1 uncharacterized protein LOC123059990 [Triticum aestivum]